MSAVVKWIVRAVAGVLIVYSLVLLFVPTDNNGVYCGSAVNSTHDCFYDGIGWAIALPCLAVAAVMLGLDSWRRRRKATPRDHGASTA